MSENKTAKTPADGEPVAWVCRGVYGFAKHCDECKQLYTEPPKREWVGLTDVDKVNLCGMIFGGRFLECIDAVEAKLKEKNT